MGEATRREIRTDDTSPELVPGLFQCFFSNKTFKRVLSNTRNQYQCFASLSLASCWALFDVNNFEILDTLNGLSTDVSGVTVRVCYLRLWRSTRSMKANMYLVFEKKLLSWFHQPYHSRSERYFFLSLTLHLGHSSDDQSVNISSSYAH